MSVEAIDKSNWPDGPWMSEPDHEVFEFEGIRCAIVRTSLGFLCGYAAMPPSHPHHGKDYNQLYEFDYEPHGGLTYSRDGVYGVEPDGSWWIGFDCAHLYDFAPGMSDSACREPTATYKNIDYVRDECRCLAKSIAGYYPDGKPEGGASS